ncbi:MAG: hypothetical protein AB8C84_06105 [Oligoflexales bacterium]
MILPQGRFISFFFAFCSLALTWALQNKALPLPYQLDWKTPSILLTSFHQPEPWGVWTQGLESEIIFKRPLPKKIRLEIKAKGFAQNTKEITTILCGTTKHQVYFSAQGNTHTMDCLDMDQTPRIYIQLLSAKSPAEISPSQDHRVLGIGIEKLKIHAL